MKSNLLFLETFHWNLLFPMHNCDYLQHFWVNKKSMLFFRILTLSLRKHRPILKLSCKSELLFVFCQGDSDKKKKRRDRKLKKKVEGALFRRWFLLIYGVPPLAIFFGFCHYRYFDGKFTLFCRKHLLLLGWVWPSSSGSPETAGGIQYRTHTHTQKWFKKEWKCIMRTKVLCFWQMNPEMNYRDQMIWTQLGQSKGTRVYR